MPRRQGVVWVWAGSLFGGGALTPPADDPGPALVDALEQPGVSYSDYSRDLHMDASTLCENVMDPAHLPYTHHMTISSRGKAQPIPFANLSPLRPDGFEADRPTEGWPGKVTFKAPHLVLRRSSNLPCPSTGFHSPSMAFHQVLAETHRGEGSFSDWNVVYAVPTAPGKCRLLVRVVFETAAMKPPLKWILSFAFNTQPTWSGAGELAPRPSRPVCAQETCTECALTVCLCACAVRAPHRWTHLGNHVILEDDNPFLHTQGFNYRDGDAEKLAPSWATRLYMPSTSDSMVIAFRRWLDQYTDGCGASWSDYMPRAALRGSTGSTRSTGSNGQGEWRRSTREEVLERMVSPLLSFIACRSQPPVHPLSSTGARADGLAREALRVLLGRPRQPAEGARAGGGDGRRRPRSRGARHEAPWRRLRTQRAGVRGGQGVRLIGGAHACGQVPASTQHPREGEARSERGDWHVKTWVARSLPPS